jgi:CBS domain containing-hemolysin-like protein
VTAAGLLADAPEGADWWMLLAILVLLVVLVFLAVAEMGLSRMTRPKAAALAERGLRSGKALQRLVDEPERWVNPLLLTVNICQIVQATFTAILADRLFGPAGVVVGVVLNVIVFFVLAEAVPKTYAVLHPERAALVAARPTLALVSFWPLRMVSKALIGLTNVIVRGKGLEKGPFVSEQELLGYVEAAAEDEVIEHEERELIESIIEFGDTVAREIMVPRPDMVTVDHDESVSTALDLAIREGKSRLPVMNDEDDDVVGLAYLKDLIRAERQGLGDATVDTLLRPAVFIPENKSVARLMREMQAQQFHLAVVVDEYGAIAGIITLEDCLEELVGEIVDEYDTEQAEVQQLPGGEYTVDGGMSISDLNDLLDTHLPDDDWDTVAGFVFGMLEHVPAPGESVDFDGWRFSAERMEGRRIRRVRISAVGHERDE